MTTDELQELEKMSMEESEGNAHILILENLEKLFTSWDLVK